MPPEYAEPFEPTTVSMSLTCMPQSCSPPLSASPCAPSWASPPVQSRYSPPTAMPGALINAHSYCLAGAKEATTTPAASVSVSRAPAD